MSAMIAVAMLGAAAQAQIGQPPGERFVVRPADMPPPYATPSAGNPPRQVLRPADTTLKVPRGFVANLFAEDLDHPRYLAVASNGDVFLAESSAGKITLLRDADGDGKAELRTTFVDGLRRPHGIAFRPGWVYVADTERVWRIPYEPGDTQARARPEAVTADGALGSSGGHWTRNIVFAPDGAKFYVSIGSAGNIAEEALPRASVVEFRADGSAPRMFGWGLRNPVGIAIRPDSDDVWTVVNERDGMGDGLVPDFFTRIVDGGFYVWPYAYIGPNPQPGFAERRPDLVRQALVPDLLFRSHSAPIGLTFYTGASFPAEYRGDAFVALRGSWNSGKPTGYVVARVPFRDGRLAGHYETFASGFWIGGVERANVWGRPTGVAVAADGALLIADDTGLTVWRIQWRGG
ncbi:MAG: sorbosone dehydrogenase family protein [Rhodospirillales bacterium]|nr:sorbosone dehydrogenase family protein [Rhodospirillales bacterium]